MIDATKTTRRIALVADSPNWVFARIASRIAGHVGYPYETSIFFTNETSSFQELVQRLFAGDQVFDLVHFFWRHDHSDLFHPRTWALLAKSCDELTLARIATRIARTIKTTWICDHLFLDETIVSLWNRRTLMYASAYGVSSKALKAIYSGITPDQHIHELQDGVDLGIFHPTSIDRPLETRDNIVIGWAGNSEWGKKDSDHKGLKTVVKPAIERLQSSKLPVRHRFCDRIQGWTAFEDMPAYFQSIDILTCASINEGTPNTILEAMACGLPIVTTRVGIVEELFGPLQREFIVDVRSVESFEYKLRTLVEDENLRRRIREENLKSIKKWDWGVRIVHWGDFMDDAMARPRNPSLDQEQLRTLDYSLAIGKRHIASFQELEV